MEDRRPRLSSPPRRVDRGRICLDVRRLPRKSPTPSAHRTSRRDVFCDVRHDRSARASTSVANDRIGNVPRRKRGDVIPVCGRDHARSRASDPATVFAVSLADSDAANQRRVGPSNQQGDSQTWSAVDRRIVRSDRTPRSEHPAEGGVHLSKPGSGRTCHVT